MLKVHDHCHAVRLIIAVPIVAALLALTVSQANRIISPTHAATQENFTPPLRNVPDFPVELLFEVDRLTTQAHQSFDDRDYANTIELITVAIDKMQKHNLHQATAVMYALRGQAYAFSKNDNAALKDYETALNINPDFTDVYAVRAYIYLRKNRYDQAESDVRRALEAYPKDGAIRHSLGDVLYYSGRHKDASKEWEKACQLANASTIEQWQSDLKRLQFYSKQTDGKCNPNLLEAFAKCASVRCQY